MTTALRAEVKSQAIGRGLPLRDRTFSQTYLCLYSQKPCLLHSERPRTGDQRLRQGDRAS